MQDHVVFWRFEALSDRQLLEQLGSVLGSSRRMMAELIAQLGEVEERRLHLAAACSSMFAYCLKLGMTEDEAYRRIEVARLARRYPAIFPLLANGQLSISVVALLKHHLSKENHLELLAAVTGKSVAQTRELIAARFPRPDVPSSVRKLPERLTMLQPSLALSMVTESSASEMAASRGGTASSTSQTEPCFTAHVTEPRADVTAPRASQAEPCFTANVTRSMEVPATPASADVARDEASMGFASAVDGTRAIALENPALTGSQRAAPSHPSDTQRIAATPPPADTRRAAPSRPSSRIEPLSARRYKVQFTASAELARKLELARDLMRHSCPDGDLGPIVERALDLLIESLMQRRFGKIKKERPKPTSESKASRSAMGVPSSRVGYANPEPRGDIMTARSAMRDTDEPRTSTNGIAEPAGAGPRNLMPDAAKPRATTLADAPTPHTTTLDAARPAKSATLDSAGPRIGAPLDSADVHGDPPGEPERVSDTAYIPRSARRAVVERDGLGCSWVDERGVRCGSRAWLEYDHRQPRAKGGGSEPDNLRLLCRHHNRFSAEREYGRKHVEHTIAEQRRARASHTPPAI